MTTTPKKRLILLVLAAAALAAGAYAWTHLRSTGPGEGFASGNGRIEATEVDVATKLAGRIASIAIH